MVLFPITCPHCGQERRHSGSCFCPNAQLDAIDRERVTIKIRLDKLDALEAAERTKLTKARLVDWSKSQTVKLTGK